MRATVTGRLPLVIVLVTLLAAQPASAQTACTQFASEFTALQQQIGAIMGTPSGCPRVEANGDTVQATSTGLAIHLPNGTDIFAAGDDHWALSGAGLEQWTGNWHNGLLPPVTPEPEAPASQILPSPEAQSSVQPMRLIRVVQDGTNTVVVEDAAGSMFTVETANGCPDADAAVGDLVFVRSGGSQTDLILVQQHETCAVAVTHTTPGD